MRKSSLLVASVICASLAIGSTPAFADTPSTPKVKKEKVRTITLEEITIRYIKAIEKANKSAERAKKRAKTTSELWAIKDARNAAIIAATTARAEAILALALEVIPADAPHMESPRMGTPRPEQGEKAPRGAKAKRN